MDLGLSELSDDQIVELLSEVCAELAQRDGVVRRAAQAQIDQKAKELQIMRIEAERIHFTRRHREELLEFAVGTALQRAKADYLKELEEDVYQFICTQVRLGARVLTPEEELEEILKVPSGELRVFVNQGYDPNFVLEQLKEIGVEGRWTGAQILCFMNSTQREKFMRMPGGAAHRIEPLKAHDRAYGKAF